MKIYDITQEVFTCNVFPGDPAPSYERVLEIGKGSICNLTTVSMCAHNGTHLDAPWHFYENGKKVEELDLDRCIGEATVVTMEGELTAEVIRAVMEKETCRKRLLIRGKAVVTLEAAKEMNRQGILLVGVESQTVGPEDGPAQVHYELLGKEVILLEGLVLEQVPDGNYFLSAAPLKLGGADGAPCRAVLIAGEAGKINGNPNILLH